MSVSDWQQQQLTGMAAMMQRLGLDLLGSAPCRHAPASAIDICRNCASRDSCRGWLMPEDIAPEDLPAVCPKAQRLEELMADLEFVAPTATRH
jgi:Family of unknown function (DUF6455)